MITKGVVYKPTLKKIPVDIQLAVLHTFECSMYEIIRMGKHMEAINIRYMVIRILRDRNWTVRDIANAMQVTSEAISRAITRHLEMVDVDYKASYDALLENLNPSRRQIIH